MIQVEKHFLSHFYYRRFASFSLRFAGTESSAPSLSRVRITLIILIKRVNGKERFSSWMIGFFHSLFPDSFLEINLISSYSFSFSPLAPFALLLSIIIIFGRCRVFEFARFSSSPSRPTSDFFSQESVYYSRFDLRQAEQSRPPRSPITTLLAHIKILLIYCSLLN